MESLVPGFFPSVETVMSEEYALGANLKREAGMAISLMLSMYFVICFSPHPVNHTCASYSVSFGRGVVHFYIAVHGIFFEHC